MRLGLIGQSIQYSLSPRIHTYWLNLYNIPGTYELIDDDFSAISNLLKKENFSGLNVTIPYKTKIIDLFPGVVSSLEAINTLLFAPDKPVQGINTDYQAALVLFKQKRPKRIVILGAGGAAKAMIHAAEEIGCESIHMCSRQVVEGNFTWHPWSDRDQVVGLGGLVINATCLKDESVLKDWNCLSPHTSIMDLTYDLKRDPFLTQFARHNGIDLISGKEFLLYQAQRSFHYWTGILPEITPDLLKELS